MRHPIPNGSACKNLELSPTSAGCYLYKNAEGEVIYVGKAKNLRARVRSYFVAANQMTQKTGSLMREAVDLEYITVANEHEALSARKQPGSNSASRGSISCCGTTRPIRTSS